MHIPFFYEKDDKIFVKIGSEDNFINQEEKHFIEYV
jgi:hypothetical protein